MKIDLTPAQASSVHEYLIFIEDAQGQRIWVSATSYVTTRRRIIKRFRNEAFIYPVIKVFATDREGNVVE